MAGSLFERLTGGTEALRLDEAESVRRHLLRLFTARQGSVQALPDYGLPDCNDVSLSRSDLAARNCRAVRDCIARYEPRLADVEVRPAPADEENLIQAFRISAQLLANGGEMVPWQWTVLLSGGEARAKP